MKHITLQDFIPINFGIYIYENSNKDTEFIYQEPMCFDNSRYAQTQPHIVVRTKKSNYNKPVENWDEALKIFNTEL